MPKLTTQFRSGDINHMRWTLEPIQKGNIEDCTLINDLACLRTWL